MKWKKDALLRQIEYGASLGQINLENAKNELDSFFENEAELINYFQHHKMLHVVRRWKIVFSMIKSKFCTFSDKKLSYGTT